ncbi:MAG: PQQ-binding-like beta-propeller repeat protein [Phycisphaerae bacterium]
MADARKPQIRSVARSVALISGAFCVTVVALLAWEARRGGVDPWDSPEFQQLQSQLRQNPGDEELRQKIRDKDLRLRREFFRRRAFLRRGSWLLAGGLAVLLVSAHVSTTGSRPRVPAGGGDPQRREQTSRLAARWSVAAVTVGLASAAAAWGLLSPNPLSKPSAAEEEPVAAEKPADDSPPDEDEILANWPRFRGPGGLGIAHGEDFPDQWDGPDGENVLWKSEPVALEGESSPVVWGDKVFITGADADTRELYCYHADTGELLWRHEADKIPGARPGVPEVMQDTGFAAPSPTTDGRYVVAMFANGDVVCTDTEGNRVWARNLGDPVNAYGHASSPIIHGEVVIIQFDQGSDPDEMLSELYAIELETGTVRYLQGRPVVNSWSTPLVADTPDGEQLITTSSPWVIAYDPADGSEIWRADCLSGDVGPSPTYADGKAYTVTAYSQLSAIRTDGEGDVTDSHIEWVAYDALPDISSPLATADRVWIVQTYGFMTCLDADSGEVIYEHDFAETVRSSPTLVGDEVHVMTAEGVTHRFSASADEHRELGTCRLGEMSNCSPAYVDGRIYIRGRQHLWCIGQE